MHRAFIACSMLLSVLWLASCASTPKYLDEPVEELYRLGVEKIEAGNYEEAREIMETLKARDAQKLYYPFAQIRIADSYFSERRYAEAAVEYEAFLKLHPYHQSAPYAQYRLGLSVFNQIEGVDRGFGHVKQAKQHFLTLLDRYPRNRYRDPAEIKIRQCDDLLAEYENYVGMFYFDKGSYRAALGRFEGILKTFPESAIVPEVLYHLGLSYEFTGQPDKAKAAFARLASEFPLSDRAADAQERLSGD